MSIGDEKKYSKDAWSSKRAPTGLKTGPSGGGGTAGGGKEGGVLGKAVSELKAQHPLKYDDRGPHHAKHVERHDPIGGLHAKSSHGR